MPQEIPRGEPQNIKLDVKGMFRSSPIPVVANGFGRTDEVQRAGARRGCPVKKSGTTYTVCLRGNESCGRFAGCRLGCWYRRFLVGLHILDWVVCLRELEETSGEFVPGGKSSGCHELESVVMAETSNYFFVAENTSNLCMLGVTDPRSGRALKRPAVTNC